MLAVHTFVFNPFQENTYLLFNEKRHGCIIDPGCYFPEEKNKLKYFVQEQAFHPVLLLNTHGHLDHIFGNKFIAETWGLVPHIHEKEKPLLDQAPEAAEMWGVPLDPYAGELNYIREGSFLSIDGDKLEILFTPGHSPGSVSFYHAEGGYIIGGDVLFSGSIGRTDLPGGDFDTLIHTIQTQFFTLPDDTKVYSGHGPVTTIGFEKMNNPFVKLY